MTRPGAKSVARPVTGPPRWADVKARRDEAVRRTRSDQPFVSEGIREYRIRGRYVGSSWGYFNYVLNGNYEVAPLLRTFTDLTQPRVDLLTTRG